MSLTMPLPNEILALLERNGVRPESIKISTDTDLDQNAEYARQWLVVTDESIFRISDGGQSRTGASPGRSSGTQARVPLILQHIALDSIRSARLDVRVGTGIVEVEADDQFVEIIRFSNLYADRFAKVSAKLDQRANGFPIEITETDNKDDRRCEKCGMATWATGGVCPRCVNKSA